MTTITSVTGLSVHQAHELGAILACISAFLFGLAGRIPGTAIWLAEVQPGTTIDDLGPVARRLDRARDWLHQRTLERKAERAADDQWGETLTTMPAVDAEPAWQPETAGQRAAREARIHEPLAPLPPQPAGPGAVDMGQLYRTVPGEAQPLQPGVHAFRPEPETAVITGVISDVGQAQRQPEPETQQVTMARIVPPSIELDQDLQAKFARLMEGSTAGPVTQRVRELISAQ